MTDLLYSEPVPWNIAVSSNNPKKKSVTICVTLAPYASAVSVAERKND